MSICLKVRGNKVSKLAPIVVESPQPQRWQFLKPGKRGLGTESGEPVSKRFIVPLQIN